MFIPQSADSFTWLQQAICEEQEQASSELLAVRADKNADLLVRWPHLARCSPQPENQIGTLREQFARAKAGRQAEPLPAEEAERIAATIQARLDLFGSILTPLIHEVMSRFLAEELPAAVDYLVSRNRGQYGKVA